MKIHPNNKRFEIEEGEEIITANHPKADKYSVLHDGKVLDSDKVIAVVITRRKKKDDN